MWHYNNSTGTLFTAKNIGEGKMKVQKKNYTLIEILAVIAIIAVLAGLTVGVSTLVMRKSADTKTAAAIKYVEMALEKFKNENGYYPTSANGGVDILKFEKNPNNTAPAFRLSRLFDEKFRSANTKSITVSGTEYLYIVDGYGNPMIYRSPGYFNKGKYDFGSVGKDKKVGDNASGDVVPESLNTNGQFSHSNLNSQFQSDFGNGDDIVNFTVSQP